MNQAFIGDFSFKGAFHAVTLRSPIASGRLVGIDAPAMFGNYTLIRAHDIPGINILEGSQHPILADREISYKGEPVAILVGPERGRLEIYLSQCKIRTKKDTAPPPVATPTALGPAVFPAAPPNAEPPEASRIFESGDLDAAFSEASTIVEGAYKTGIQEHWYSDPHGAVVNFSHDKLMVHTATQWPFHVRDSVAKTLKLKAEDVVVCPSILGVHLDGKLWYPSLISCHAALAAVICKKSVKLLLTRHEDFAYSPKRYGSEIKIKTALGSGGEILGTAVDIAADIGAYGFLTDETIDHMSLGAVGAYKHASLQMTAKTKNSNTPPRGPFCGFGLSQGFFAIEKHMSKIADALGQDPAEWRKSHLPQKNGELALGIPFKLNRNPDALLDSSMAMGDYGRKWSSYELLRTSRRKEGGHKLDSLRGIGIALGFQTAGLIHPVNEKDNFAVELTLDKDGKLKIKTSLSFTGKGTVDLWRQMAAHILSLEMDEVSVNVNNTDEVPDSGPSCLSRNVTVVTKLVERCCTAIRRQRFRDPLPITVRRAYNPALKHGWNNKPLDLSAFSHLSWASAVVEVEIDSIEFTPKVRGVWLSIDGGRILSKEKARNSMKFLVIQALGWASMEQIDYQNEEISSVSSIWYNMPSTRDEPPIKIDFLSPDASNMKGISELPFNCIPAAYAQAVSQAVDYHFESIPIGPHQIWKAIKSRQEGGI